MSNDGRLRTHACARAARPARVLGASPRPRHERRHRHGARIRRTCTRCSSPSRTAAAKALPRAHAWRDALEQVHVDYALPRGEDPKGERVPAVTDETAGLVFEDRHSLVECACPAPAAFTRSGRHLSHLRHPILGDTNYGDRKETRAFRERFGSCASPCTRVALRLHPGEVVRVGGVSPRPLGTARGHGSRRRGPCCYARRPGGQSAGNTPALSLGALFENVRLLVSNT